MYYMTNRYVSPTSIKYQPRAIYCLTLHCRWVWKAYWRICQLRWGPYWLFVWWWCFRWITVRPYKKHGGSEIHKKQSDNAFYVVSAFDEIARIDENMWWVDKTKGEICRVFWAWLLNNPAAKPFKFWTSGWEVVLIDAVFGKVKPSKIHAGRWRTGISIGWCPDN